MPIYMKAYELKDLRRFTGWPRQELRSDPPAADKTDGANDLNDETVVYVQEDYSVTTDISGATIFDGKDPEWQRYCREQLGFAVPDWDAESAAVRAALATQDSPDTSTANSMGGAATD